MMSDRTIMSDIVSSSQNPISRFIDGVSLIAVLCAYPFLLFIVSTMLSEYAKCRTLEDRTKAEMTDVLSHAMAQAATRSSTDYALPGALPTWQEAMLNYGDHPIGNMLIRKIPNMTDEMREWAAHYGIEYVARKRRKQR